MNSYLSIAEQVLSKAKRPMRPKKILDEAYMGGIVPTHLYGATQHKTLQARISEDIIEKRDESAFFRTAPGKFFLRRFLYDETIPEDYRQPIVSRRRVRELRPQHALQVESSELNAAIGASTVVKPERIHELLNDAAVVYRDPRKSGKSATFIWSFAVVRKGHSILSYRSGRYREDRDSFALKRSIGFKAMVAPKHQTLFSIDDYGVRDSGLEAVQTDLDIPGGSDVFDHTDPDNGVDYYIRVRDDDAPDALIGVVEFKCPFWFEPTKRRLSMHDVAWLDARYPPNNLEDFDPWSRRVIEYEFSLTPLGAGAN